MGNGAKPRLCDSSNVTSGQAKEASAGRSDGDRERLRLSAPGPGRSDSRHVEQLALWLALGVPDHHRLVVAHGEQLARVGPAQSGDDVAVPLDLLLLDGELHFGSLRRQSRWLAQHSTAAVRFAWRKPNTEGKHIKGVPGSR